MLEPEPREMLEILLIEDDPLQCRLLQHLLRRATPPFQVDAVGSLADGLEQLELRDFAAVIIDLGLPDSQGLATFVAVHTAFPNVPAVVLTGNDDEQLAIDAVRHGAQDYIVKSHDAQQTIVRSLRYAIERKRLEDQLLQSQKMQAIGELADGIAHEFNNLLQVIQGYTRYALEGLDEDEQRYRDLNQVMNAAEQAAELTGQFLQFGRPGMRRGVVHLDEVVRELVVLVRPLLGDKIRLEIQLSGDDARLVADRNMLQQMLMNLCINARDAMPDGGSLTIRSQCVHLDEDACEPYGCLQPGPYVALSVADSGCGIPESELAQVFDPFFTTKEPQEGTGLGLPMVQRTVQQHGGTVRIESRLGEGTTIEILLPLSDGDPCPHGLVRQTVNTVDDADEWIDFGPLLSF